MKFFKLEDFGSPLAESISELKIYADLANEKLEREGKIVYSSKNSDGYMYWSPSEKMDHMYTRHSHKALLINIEPINKCEHPKDKISYKFGQGLKLEDIRFPGPQKYELPHWVCECGAKVQPKDFEEVR